MMDAEARRALLEHAIRLYGEPAQNGVQRGGRSDH